MRYVAASVVFPPLAVLGACSGPGAGHADDPRQSASRACSAVHVLFGRDAVDHGIFPTDLFTTSDGTQKTGLRVRLPAPDCSVHVSDCLDLVHIDELDGFTLQPRLTIPFDGDVDTRTLSSRTAFFVALGEASAPRAIGINQMAWDPESRMFAVQSDEQLQQSTRYAFVVTDGLLDTCGAPVRAAPGLLDEGQKTGPYPDALRTALGLLGRLGVSQDRVAGLSVFTTQSATAVLEHIRDDLRAVTPDPVSFSLAAGGARTVFSLRRIVAVDWQVQIKASPPIFKPFATAFYHNVTQPYFTLLDRYLTGAVGALAYGSYRSPRYIAEEPVMPAVGTLAGRPPVQSVDTIYVNFFVPTGKPPAAGWPVVVFGVGGGDIKDEETYFYAAAFAARGLATACINVNGQGYGPRSYLTVTLDDGASFRFPSGGRGRDLNGDGDIKDTEGVQTVSAAHRILGARDTIRQTVIDLMQLVREIQVGVDLDGDGRADLDASRIAYFGMSFGGGALGPTFMAVESSLTHGVLGSPAGLNSRWDLQRLRPVGRPAVGANLQAREPSLLNAPGLTAWGGVPVAPPFFDENIPLRNQRIVLGHVDGAFAIQRYFDNVAWVAASGDGASYVPHIRKEPLAGNRPKAILFQVQRGDLSAPNPRSTQLARAGDLAAVTTLYRNDLAYADDHTVDKNAHTMQFRWMIPGVSGPVGRGSLEQTAIFLGSGGQTIVHPEPAKYFETPISLPLPEDFAYIS